MNVKTWKSIDDEAGVCANFMRASPYYTSVPTFMAQNFLRWLKIWIFEEFSRFKTFSAENFKIFIQAHLKDHCQFLLLFKIGSASIKAKERLKLTLVSLEYFKLCWHYATCNQYYAKFSTSFNRVCLKIAYELVNVRQHVCENLSVNSF